MTACHASARLTPLPPGKPSLCRGSAQSIVVAGSCLGSLLSAQGSLPGATDDPTFKTAHCRLPGPRRPLLLLHPAHVAGRLRSLRSIPPAFYWPSPSVSVHGGTLAAAVAGGHPSNGEHRGCLPVLQSATRPPSGSWGASNVSSTRATAHRGRKMAFTFSGGRP